MPIGGQGTEFLDHDCPDCTISAANTIRKDIVQVTTVTRTMTLKINARQLRALIKEAAGMDVPENALIEHHGYHGDCCDLDDDHPVVISWKETSTETESNA